MSPTVTLHSLIATVLASTALCDPREIAALVAQRTPPEQLEQFYAQTLIAEVRTTLATRRNTALNHTMNASSPTRSSKVAGIRDWWAELLAARVHVGDARWLNLGECGRKELAFAAAERRVHAEHELHRADQYDQLAGLLRTHRVRTVAKLPADAVRRTFGSEAA